MKRIGYVFILVGLLLPLVLLTNMSVQEFQVFQQYQYYRRNSKFFSTEQLEEIKAYG
ncbi:class C sortase, partial [Streptococcus suis]|nr:class C sortase [Streptococcus suis]